MRCPIDKTPAVMQIFLTFLLCSCMLIHSGFVNKKRKKNTAQSLTVKLSPKIIYCCDNSKLYVRGDLWRWLGQRLVASGAQARVALKPAREGSAPAHRGWPCPPQLGLRSPLQDQGPRAEGLGRVHTHQPEADGGVREPRSGQGRF